MACVLATQINILPPLFVELVASAEHTYYPKRHFTYFIHRDLGYVIS